MLCDEGCRELAADTQYLRAERKAQTLSSAGNLLVTYGVALDGKPFPHTEKLRSKEELKKEERI